MTGSRTADYLTRPVRPNGGLCPVVLVIRRAQLALDSRDDLIPPVARPLRVHPPCLCRREDNVVRSTDEHLTFDGDRNPRAVPEFFVEERVSPRVPYAPTADRVGVTHRASAGRGIT